MDSIRLRQLWFYKYQITVTYPGYPPEKQYFLLRFNHLPTQLEIYKRIERQKQYYPRRTLINSITQVKSYTRWEIAIKIDADYRNFLLKFNHRPKMQEVLDRIQHVYVDLPAKNYAKIYYPNYSSQLVQALKDIVVKHQYQLDFESGPF